jgi:hypothetical protein
LVWVKVYEITGEICQIELLYKNDDALETDAFDLISKVAIDLSKKYNGVKSYTYKEVYETSKADVLRHISKDQPLVKK